MTFRTHEDIFWKVEIIDYKADNRWLKVSVKEYSTSDIANFDKQEPDKPVDELIFEPVDWLKLEPLLIHYQRSRLTEFLSDKNPYPFSRGEERTHMPDRNNQQSKYMPIVQIITEDFWIYFTDAHFILGYVTFEKKIKKIGKAVAFKIPNEHILAEFDNIKGWFAKKLKTKRFKVAVSIKLVDNEVIETKARSKHIEQITPELIDSVKYQRTVALTKEPRSSNPDKSLFTAEDIFTQIDSDDIEGNVFKQSDEDILNFFLKESNVRNIKQLVYLAGEKQSENYKLRYTLYPIFGFLFLIEGAKSNHFVWELLNSHATYIWSIEKEEQNEELLFKRIEHILAVVREIGRDKYKRTYRNNQLHNGFVFRAIDHEGIGSKLEENFPKWKSRLNEQLT
jgi:hypothetical protein